jgi:hypothetical protein
VLGFSLELKKENLQPLPLEPTKLQSSVRVECGCLIPERMQSNCPTGASELGVNVGEAMSSRGGDSIQGEIRALWRKKTRVLCPEK